MHPMCKPALLLCVSAVVGNSNVLAASLYNTARGELLYNTHCVACHTTQVHWREQRLAQDWETLTKQVHRWQANVGLNWNDEDIAAVASYLNKLYYEYPEKAKEKVLSDSKIFR